jgi:class 3 adenylate cyclase
MTDSPTQLTIGVTGHLLLSARERQHVASHARAQLDGLVSEVGAIDQIRLISGMAPGADLVLTETLMAGCKAHGIDCQLTAVLVDSPEDVIKRWQQRAAELGASISPFVVEDVTQRLRSNLARAQRQIRFVTPERNAMQGYRQLAALIAESCDVLFAVIRPDHPHKGGGAAETLSWWEDRDQIPLSFRLNSTVSKDTGHRRLVRINPEVHSASLLRHVLAEVSEVREHLRAGNALTANDIATRALRQYPRHSLLRYYYLLSLAQSGSTRRALYLYPKMLLEMSITADEDWIALHGRLHKDLAFLRRDRTSNLELAAKYYAQAADETGGVFSAINAATLNALAGRKEEALRYANDVFRKTDAIAPQNEVDAYYHHVSRAEAYTILQMWEACKKELVLADPLICNDLSTRARTRNQLREIVHHYGADPAILQALALPSVYVLASDEPLPGKISPQLRKRLEGSPLYAMQAWQDAAPHAGFQQLADLGMRIHLLTDESDGAALQGSKIERRMVLRGFCDSESIWRKQVSQRYLRGMAKINAQQLGVEVQTLEIAGEGDHREWTISPAAESLTDIQPPSGRQMVGLVFTDFAGFSKFSDEDIDIYWSQIVPALSRAIEPWQHAILLQRTWGDAIHLVTQDAVTAALATQAMLKTVRRLRRKMKASMPSLEMRVGAHFAPAYIGQDMIAGERTWFGSQLSLTARVEPVTPPGMTYVTEPLAAELAIAAPERFVLEYAGEVHLAKGYGEFRLYGLNDRGDD